MHVVTIPPEPTPLAPALPDLEVVGVPAARDNLVWVIADRRLRRAAIVDGPDAEGALALCARDGLTPEAVLVTHTHADHVGVLHDLARRGLAGGPGGLRVIGPRAARAAVPGITDPVAGGDALSLFGARVDVITTEGHLDGHVSYVIGRALFSGDALFTGGCGRMFSGPATAFQAGLARLAALPDDTLVFCAHEYTEDNLAFAAWLEPDDDAIARRLADTRARRAGGRRVVPSTMGLERATNPFLRWGAASLAAAVARAAPGVDVSTPVAIFAAARRLKDTAPHRRAG